MYSKTQFFKYFFFYVLIYFLFSIAYITTIVPYFFYEGYYLNISREKIVLSILFLFLFSLSLEKKEKISVSLINALIGFSIIPMFVLFSLKDLSIEYIIYTVISVFVIIIFSKIKITYKLFPINAKFIIYIVIMLSLVILGYLYNINKRYFNLNITKVYEFRHLITSNTPTIISYIYNLLFKGLLSLIFLYYMFYLKYKFQKFFLSIFMIFIYVLIFGLTSHKFYLFIIPILILFYLALTIMKNNNFIFIKGVLFLLLGILICSFFCKKSDLSIILLSLFLRRVFFVPAMLNFSYFEFFRNHSFVYFTDSNFLPFKYILGYPYDVDVAHLIGREIFGKPEMGANTGWLGSGFAHLGFIGMLLYAILISLILKYLDYISKYLKKGFIIITFIPYIITLFLSSDLKTTFITHGLIFYLMLLNFFAYYRKKEDLKVGKKNLSYHNSSSKIRCQDIS